MRYPGFPRVESPFPDDPRIPARVRHRGVLPSDPSERVPRQSGADDGHRVVSPFPVTIRNGKAHIRAKQGITFQVLVDGKRIVDVTSHGEDVDALDD